MFIETAIKACVGYGMEHPTVVVVSKFDGLWIFNIQICQ